MTSVNRRRDHGWVVEEESWRVDCACGVNFDDGEEMVNCDDCGVWVHTRCSGYLQIQGSFVCDKCKEKRWLIEEESWRVDCACGVNFDDGEEMVNCDDCGVWVHTRCSGYLQIQGSFVCDKCKEKRWLIEEESWRVDCLCGVNFDDGEEMVNCDDCGVWVHTRCSGYLQIQGSFVCDKCKEKRWLIEEESWRVDCLCGVNFDDGEEMVNCDDCGVWVHTRCSGYLQIQGSFVCDKCKEKRWLIEEESWRVDCLCGVNFDDGEEMVNCGDCGVWVHTRCYSPFNFKSQESFVCDKCKENKKDDPNNYAAEQELSQEVTQPIHKYNKADFDGKRSFASAVAAQLNRTVGGLSLSSESGTGDTLLLDRARKLLRGNLGSIQMFGMGLEDSDDNWTTLASSPPSSIDLGSGL